jgi:hypothetical protein
MDDPEAWVYNPHETAAQPDVLPVFLEPAPWVEDEPDCE